MGGFPFILKSYNGFCVGIFLAIYVMYWENSRARTSILNGRPFRYQWSWNALHGIKLLGKLWKLLWKKKNGNPMLRTDVTRENAHAIVRAPIFLKCLKWLETYSYLIKKWFWAFKNFTHAQLHHAYAYARAHIFKKLHNDLKFHVMTYEIVMIIIQRDIIDMLNSQNGV